MLNEAVDKTSCAEDKVKEIIPIRRLVNRRKIIYKLAVEVRTIININLGSGQRRFEVAEDMCKKLKSPPLTTENVS